METFRQKMESFSRWFKVCQFNFEFINIYNIKIIPKKFHFSKWVSFFSVFQRAVLEKTLGYIGYNYVINGRLKLPYWVFGTAHTMAQTNLTAARQFFGSLDFTDKGASSRTALWKTVGWTDLVVSHPFFSILS